MIAHAVRRSPRLRCISVVALLAASLVVTTAAAQKPASATYTERYRPQYHFTPATNWMNDPNGLVFFRGEYHLFYQYNPFGIAWGHMSWGHAVSPDLVHWTHLPVAIPEADGVMAFSGSAVVDWRNTSGFGRGGEPPLVAIYAGFRPADRNQSQYIAYSRDRGHTWTRYGGNPVIDIGSTDFRDPKVFWYAPTKHWVMVVALSAQHQVRFYSSPDLKRWTQLSDFGPAGATGGAWECPDLFELPVDGNPANTRWVLIVNINPGAVAGGSGTQYFVGRFDGTRFVADVARQATGAPGLRADSMATRDASGGIPARWADYGKDFYAAVSWSDIPRADGRRIWIGWMNNWQYGTQIPTTPWRSAQSVPRTLGLRTTPDGVRLVQQPVVELRRLRGDPHSLGARRIAEGTTALEGRGIAGTAMEIAADLAPGTASDFGLEVRTGDDDRTIIGIDPKAGQLFVDRTHSGAVDFHKDFSGRQTAPLPFEHGRVHLRVLVDWSSVEVFAGDGRAVITDQIFPSPESRGVALYARGGDAQLLSFVAWPLSSAWSTSTTKVAAPGGRARQRRVRRN